MKELKMLDSQRVAINEAKVRLYKDFREHGNELDFCFFLNTKEEMLAHAELEREDAFRSRRPR